MLKFPQLLSRSHFCLQELQHLLTCRFLFFMTDYDVWFIVRNSSVCPRIRFHNMLTLPSWLVSNDLDSWSYYCSLSNFTRITLRMLKCSWILTLSWLLCNVL
jgi:hypothetical protein